MDLQEDKSVFSGLKEAHGYVNLKVTKINVILKRNLQVKQRNPCFCSMKLSAVLYTLIVVRMYISLLQITFQHLL